MKKSIRILAMLMVAAMLCSMLPVSACAAGATSAAGNVYYTGADYTSDTVAIDGVISAEDGYVDLTPNGVPLTLVNETLESERWGGDLPTTFTLAEPKAEHIAVGLTTETIVVKYYVAQDDENVYLAIEETMPEKAYEVEGVAYNTGKYLMNNLKLGFNAADPAQQIDLFSDGFWAATGGSGTKWDVTYEGWIEHPFIVTGLSDTEEFVSKKGPATEIVADYVDDVNFPKDSRMEMVKAEGMVTRTYELKLNKAGIEAAYADVFGATDIGFDSMFVVMSSTDYEWANNDDNYSLLFVTGTVNDGNLISDKVVFGNDPNAPQEYPAALGNTLTAVDYDAANVTVDGLVDDAGYAEITPTLSFVNDVIESEGIGKEIVSKAPNAENTQADEFSVKYYVAQDDDYVYLAVKIYEPEVTYTVDGITYENRKEHLMNLKLGFNPDNYKEQINLYTNGFITTAANKQHMGITLADAWTAYPFVVSGLANATDFVALKGTDSDIIENYVTAENKPLESVGKYTRVANTDVTRVYEMKLSKAGIAEAYANVFGSEVDFDQMFIGLSGTNDYVWANSKDNFSLAWYNGTVVDANTAAANDTVTAIPDRVVLKAAAPSTTVDGYKTVVSDGAIGADEYTTTYNYNAPVAYSASQTFETLNPAYEGDKRVAESMSISFAHDANKIYVGVVGKGGTGSTASADAMRDGYALRFGFDPAHPENYIGISLIETGANNADANDKSKTAVHDALDIDGYDYAQIEYRGIFSSKGDLTNFNIKDQSHANLTKYTTVDALANSPITGMKVVKQTVSGDDIVFGSGHGRTTAQQVYTYWEIEFDKALLLAFFNEMYDNGEGVENLDTMLYSVSQFYGLSDNGYIPQAMFNGSFGEVADGTHAMTAYTFDTVTFTAPAVHEHTPIVDAAVAATCTENGLTEGSHCACGEVLVAQEVVPATGHTEEDVAAVAPTCTETGLTAGKICSVCEETIVAQTVVDATGHAFDDDADATCNNCDYVREVESTDDTTDVADDTTEPEEVTTEPAATEPATTEPATEEVTTKAPETTAPVEEKKGCGSSVTVAGLALVAALGTCTVFVAKKKED